MEVEKGLTGAASPYRIAFRGLKTGVYDFRFPVERSLFEAFESTEINDGAGEVSVRMERGEALLQLDVAIRARVVVACDRCLEDCEIPVAFEGRLLVRFSDIDQEYDGEVLWLHPSEEEVDLTQYVYESIVLSLPYRRVHPEGGCNPDMLARFSIASDEELADIASRAAQAAAGQAAEEGPKSGKGWEKLAALRERMAAEEPAGQTDEE